MKILIQALSVVLATSAAAYADVTVTPQAGYQFQTSDTKGKQIDEINQFQKNHALTGLQVGYTVTPETQVAVEYQRVDSNVKSETAGLLVNQTIYKNVYGVAGAGYYHLDSIESPYVALGVGYKQPLTNMITGKVEIREQYVTDKNFWTPTALVGFEFKLNELTKPFKSF